jgi:hypothetical protein
MRRLPIALAIFGCWLSGGAWAQDAPTASAAKEQESASNSQSASKPQSAADAAARADAVAALAPAVTTSATAAPAAQAAIDRIDLRATSITGNQELPKVLYIVPWKRSDLGDVIGRPVNTLLDEVLAPVDPEVFERHLSYYETLHGPSQEE